MNGGAQQSIQVPTPPPTTPSAVADWLNNNLTGVHATGDDVTGDLNVETVQLGTSATIKFDDGPGSAGLVPAPRNLQDPEWQTSVTDEHIEKIILYGGAAVGRSPAMPANPDLMAKKPVVAALRQHIRGLAP